MEDAVQTKPRRRPGRPENPIPRSELVRVAREQFALHGYDGVSMAEIATHAGLQKSSLFHHFPTKAELYRVALESVIAESTTAIVANTSDPGAGWPVRLDNMAAGVVRACAEPSRARLLLREFMTPAGNREGGDALHQVLKLVVAFYEDGAAAGAWPRLDFGHVVISQCGVHLVFFGLPEVSARLLGVPDVFAASVVDERVRAVQRQCRAMLSVA
jgi:AcrR family transcriptional regulator